ncbi:DUF4168 domain-containing protein [Leptolyngbya sp. FACHB-17]|uniref:DUF4168 domain-containing protein n=1 Tax=unclassified Leptolyngbya TaxID=2650499 RepID=UPI0016805182|nr:DUF4168 domain-containing protein [Leptolyngbya sp. FACHB-17]MBD2081138.1 DUF4168 domain-containing protein [Leptolyngbya sp. FACHB-17]
MSHRLMMNRDLSSLSCWLVKRSIVLGAFSSIAVLAGWAPNLSAPSIAQMFDSSASAQESSFTRYVRSAVALEQRRQALQSQLQQATGGNVPSGVCQNINQVNGGARDRVRGLCQQFRQSFYDILASQNPKLTPEEFNSFQSQVGSRQMCDRVAQEARRLKLGEISCKDAK